MKKTIAVTEKIHEEVKTLCKTLGLEFGEFVEHSMLYFKKTGVNPSKSVDESPLKAMEELKKGVGQVVGFMKEHERKKLDPLHEELMLLTNTLADSLKILPTSERFEEVVTDLNRIIDYHEKEKAYLRQSRQEIIDENKKEMTALTKALNSLQAQQKAMQTIIDDKLTKKMFS